MTLIDPSTRAPALAGEPSLRMSPEPRRRVVLSERSESKDDVTGAPGLPGGLHRRAPSRMSPKSRVETPPSPL